MKERKKNQEIKIVTVQATHRTRGLIVAAAILVVIVIAVVVIMLPKKGETQGLEEALKLGDKYLSELNYEQAVVSYRAAIEIDPKCTDAYLGLADTYFAMDKPEEALRVLEEAETAILANGTDEKTEEALRRIQEKMEEIKNWMEPEKSPTPTQEPTLVPTPIPEPTKVLEPTPNRTESQETVSSETDVERQKNELSDILVNQLGNVNIEDFCASDFDFDGNMEAFVIVGEVDDYDCCQGSLYFVTRTGVELVLSDEYFYIYDESKHILDFPDARFYLVGKYFATGQPTYVFGVSEQKWFEDEMSLRCAALSQVTGTNEMKIVCSTWDNTVDGTGHTWKPYYLYWDNGFHEYGGIYIDASDFMLCSGGSEIYNQIIDEGFTVTDIIYRANNVININYTDGYLCRNATALLNDLEVSLIQVNDYSANVLARCDYGGIYSVAFLPDIATYPTTFPLSVEKSID